MREERKVLDDVADPAFPCRDVALFFRVKEIFADCNPSLIGTAEPGDAIEHSGFSGTRGSEEDGESCGHAEMDIEVEGLLRIGKTLGDSNFEFGILRL